MTPEGKNPDESEDPHAPAEPREPGGFTRAFGGREDNPKQDDALSPDSFLSPPGSLTQALGGSSKPSQAGGEKPQVDRPLPSPSRSPTADSFTNAFDGVNAFTRDLGDLRENPFKTEAGKPLRPDAPTSSGTFTRIFGAGEGVLTPASPESESFPKPSSVPKAPGIKETSFTPGPSAASQERGGFTDAFRAQEPPHAAEANRGSFTDQFGSPTSWPTPEPPLPAAPSRARPPATTDPFRTRQDEPLGTPPRPAPSEGGFTRLVSSYGADAGPLADTTRPSIPTTRAPNIPDSSLAPPGPSSSPDATIAFNPRRSETEFSAPQGKSEYTRVVEASKFRLAADQYGTAGQAGTASPPSASAAPATPAFATPPSPVQYPKAPQPPAWPPTPAVPAPPAWGQPQMAPPAMPQAPAAPQLGMPPKLPTAGDRLVQFLPLILTLSVVNTLGLLAVLIILFATRK